MSKNKAALPRVLPMAETMALVRAAMRAGLRGEPLPGAVERPAPDAMPETEATR